MTKRKLSKLLGKNLIYTAVLGKFDPEKGRVLLTDIEHEGKKYADHLWILQNMGAKDIDEGSKIMFKATAYMYNDRFNIRKQGLNYCKNFERLTGDYHGQLIKDDEDAKQKRRRKYK